MSSALVLEQHCYSFSKLVLSGYSQGANVVGDIIAGGGGNYEGACASSAPLDPSSDAVCQIAAVMLFGDPRHTANAAYNAGTGVAGVGEFPRTVEQLERLNSYAGELRSWCAKDDPNCAKDLGLNTVEAHTNYFTYVTSEAASWAVSKIQAASGSCGQVSTSAVMPTMSPIMNGTGNATASSLPVTSAR